MDELGNDDALDEDYPELARLQQRTWGAAVPYLAAAVVAWVGAVVAEYQVTDLFVVNPQAPHALKQAILQVLTEVLVFAGVGLFAVGLLVVVLRQHDRWRRDSGRWLGYPGGPADGVTEIVRDQE